MIRSDLNFFEEQIASRPTTPPLAKISDYVQGRRLMPPGSPFPGSWDNARTPYMAEWMDNMSPHCPIQHQAVMKGAQIGCTEALTNIILYYMDECPSRIMYISATDRLLEKWVNRKLEPGIDSCGFRDKLRFNSDFVSKTRRIADKAHSKEFIGGILDTASAQSPPSLRGESVRILGRDEIDGAPPETKTGEGFWLDVSYARTNAYENTKKIFDLSTPKTFDSSEILKQYEFGDQRKYFVPCLHCNTYQVLEWDNVRPVYKSGILIDVYYECAHCKGKLYNHNKTEMLLKGEWRPTARSQSKLFRSYHISTLYSPVGMITWFTMYELFLKAEKENNMRGFTNLYLGLPYKEQGMRPKIVTLQALRGTYSSGEVPEGVLFLTMSVDVQQGQESDEGKPVRLEVEVCGHGKGFRTWSIVHKVFKGPVDDISEGSWLELTKWFGEIKGSFFRKKDGMKFPVSIVLVDSGFNAHIVYDFCRTWRYTYPSKGYSILKKKKIEERIDEAGPDYFRRYRLAKIGEDKDVYLYQISTNYYKHHIYNNLNKIRNEDKIEQSPGFCEFPKDYTKEYFEQLSAEERLADGSFYHPKHRANEALDLRVYNMAAGDIFVDKLVQSYKNSAKQRGLTDLQIQQINHTTVLDNLAQRTRVVDKK